MKFFLFYLFFVINIFCSEASDSICPILHRRFQQAMIFYSPDTVVTILSMDKRLAKIRLSGDMHPLMFACIVRRDLKIINALLEAGADARIQYEEWRLATLLHIVSISGRIDIAALLLNHGAEINAKDINGRTPMHYSQYSREPFKGKMFDFLKSRGANSKIEDKYGDKPMNLNYNNPDFREYYEC